MVYQPVDLIEVRAWERSVGAIAFDPSLGAYAFGYDPEWVANGPELSPLVMPLRREPYVFPALDPDSFHGLPGLVADSLPDAFGNAVIDSWLAQQGISRNEISALDRLAYLGDRAMGALTFRPPARALEPPATALQVADIVAQARLVIAGRVAEADAPTDALAQLIQVGSSAGGARAKAVVLFDPQTSQIRSPYGPSEPGFTSWLMKLDGVSSAADGSINALDKPAEFTRIEYAYYLMAQAAGIEMAESLLYAEGPRRHFLTRRFDRLDDGERMHMQTLSALAHLDFRYRDTHSYEQYFDAIRALNLGDAAVDQAYRRTVFNVTAVNRDDHTKNFAFLMSREGQWSLAPAYDVTHAFNPNGRWTQRHQMSINGKFDDIDLADLHRLADAQGVSAFRQTTADVLDAVARWPEFAEEAGVGQDSIDHIQQDMDRFRPI